MITAIIGIDLSKILGENVSITDEIIDVSQLLGGMCLGCLPKSKPMIVINVYYITFQFQVLNCNYSKYDICCWCEKLKMSRQDNDVHETQILPASCIGGK